MYVVFLFKIFYLFFVRFNVINFKVFLGCFFVELRRRNKIFVMILICLEYFLKFFFLEGFFLRVKGLNLFDVKFKIKLFRSYVFVLL